MKNDQFAVYRVDRNSEGRDLWHLSYQEAVSRKLAIRIEYYRQIDLRPLLPGESAIALWKRMKESCEVSDVLVLNQNGEIHCYYVNEDYPQLLSGFIRLNPSGTLVTLDTENYRISGKPGNWMAILASQLLIARMEKKGTVSRTSVVMSTSAGYILCLVLFAVGRSFWFMLLVFLLAGLMRTIKEPVLAAWMNDHVDEKMRATVFSTSGQLDSFGQIIGGPIVGLVAQQVSIPWGLVCTAFLLLPALFLVPVAGKKRD